MRSSGLDGGATGMVASGFLRRPLWDKEGLRIDR
jgi:hypothetical protein